MIEVNKGTIKMEGNLTEIGTEIVLIIQKYYSLMLKYYKSEEMVDKLIYRIVKIGMRRKANASSLRSQLF